MASQSAMGNRPEEFDRLLASDGTSRRNTQKQENQAKLKYLPAYEKKLGFAAMCRYNGAIMRARIAKKSGR